MANPTPTPIQNFTLDPKIFNPNLYNSISHFWFFDLPQNATSMNEASKQRWYSPGKTHSQRAEFDNLCRREFVHALEAVGPEKVELPEWRGYEWDVANAGVMSAPFLKEVEDAGEVGGEDGGLAQSERLLSLTILLDQLSRNIYREKAGLKMVFTHYDRLAHSLIRASLNLNPSPILHPSHALRPVIRQWFLLPLMHSEYLPSHEIFFEIANQAMKDCEAAGDEAAVRDLQQSLGFEEAHVKPLKLFGRYPHRNDALGRESTDEEVEFLRDGETFGVSQGSGKGEEKDEL